MRSYVPVSLSIPEGFQRFFFVNPFWSFAMGDNGGVDPSLLGPQQALGRLMFGDEWSVTTRAVAITYYPRELLWTPTDRAVNASGLLSIQPGVCYYYLENEPDSRKFRLGHVGSYLTLFTEDAEVFVFPRKEETVRYTAFLDSDVVYFSDTRAALMGRMPEMTKAPVSQLSSERLSAFVRPHLEALEKERASLIPKPGEDTWRLSVEEVYEGERAARETQRTMVDIVHYLADSMK